jgi:succinoglycan biosynthesis transport protein ExoP
MAMQHRLRSDGQRRAAPAEQVGEIDLGSLGRALWRRKFLVASLTFLAAAIAFGAVNLKLPAILLAALAMFALASGFILSNPWLGAIPAQLVSGPISGTAEGGRAVDVVTADRALHNAGRAAVARDAATPLAYALGAAAEKRIAVVGVGDEVDATATAITLARSLAKRARVVLIDLALDGPDLAAISDDPMAPGLAELAAGTASFGDIITRDRASRLHVITAGRKAVDAAAIRGSPRLSITLVALGRNYDHVVINAGTLGLLDHSILGAAQAVLVAAEHDHPATVAARQRMLDAGYSTVRVLICARGPASGAADAKAAA